MNRPCGALLRKGCCLACKGLTSVGLADSLRVTHCLDEGKSNRKGSLKKVPVQQGPKVRFLWPSPHIFCTCFSNLPNCSSMVFGFADCCWIPPIIPVVGALSFIAFVGLVLLLSFFIFSNLHFWHESHLPAPGPAHPLPLLCPCCPEVHPAAGARSL